jgi:HAE1 family hydrophobic/amphiphilic exporter-1
MFLSDASVKRPIAMSCLIIGLALLGFNAYRKMGLELMPKLDLPYITITTVYPGASPEEIEIDVAKRIEDQVVSIDGLKHVSSSAMENMCQTLLEFQLDVDVDIAATDVREQLDLIRADFPEDVEDPQILKFDVNAKPIIQLALVGEVPLDALYDYADNTLKDRLTVIAGVAEVQLIGGAEREVHVALDREALAARGLASTDVVSVVQAGIRTIPSGRLREGGTEYSVKFDADCERVEDIGTLEVANADGQRCYLRDVGRVEMATEELRQAATLDGRPCIAIKVVKKSDANAVAVVQAVRAAMERLNRELPGGMALAWITDDGTFTEATVNSAWINVGQGILLTAGVLFLFLYNLRSLLVVSITMPLTIVIGLFFMQMIDFTLNTSTLIAIGMSVGVLVTNSIVVLEAIDKRLAQTGDAKEAARLGASEAWVAVLASAGTNVVVLFPIAIMGSRVGLFMKPLAMTMLIMTVVSLFISFTLTPLLCSVLLRPKRAGERSLLGGMEAAWNRGFGAVTAGYRRLLLLTERNRLAALVVLAGVAAIFVHSLKVGGDAGFGFFSEPDRGEVFVKMEFPSRSDLSWANAHVAEAETLLRDLPELQHVLSAIGKVEGMFGQASEGVYLAQMTLKFSQRDEREITIQELMADARARLAGFPDAIVTIGMPSFIGGQSSDIELEIAGPELATLDQIAVDLEAEVSALPGILDPDTTARQGKPELRVRPRRAVLSDMGAPATGLGMALRGNLEGLEAGTFKYAARNYDIVVKLAEREGKDQVDRFLFPGEPGHPLVLETLGEVESGVTPIQVSRKDKRRVSKLFANLGPGLPLGPAVGQIERVLDESGLLPVGYDHQFAGDYEVMAEAQQEFGEAGLMAIVLVILTLAAILESFKQPFLILVTLPLSLVGVFWALRLAGMSMEVFVLMALVMLVGIVVNNAILIMDQLNVHLKEGMPRHSAMVNAACERLRPIIMITLAAVLGMLPLAFGSGIGAEMRNAVGVASAGGILISGVLTLLVLPILYDLFTRRQGAAH